MAGLSVAAVALPVGLAYAAMMGVPPVAGLWAAIAGMLGYAVFGSSRTLIVGPDTATCTLIAATLTGMALTDPQDRLVAATGIALTVGVGCLIARVLRLGVLANLLSRPVLIGYMAGVAITLALSQLSGLTGVGLRNSGLIHPFLELSRRLPEIRIPTLALGLGSCLLLIAVKRWRPNWPGPILLVVGACAASWAFDFPGMGIAVVGEVPAGLPALSLPVRLDGVDDMLLGAAGVLVVSFSSGIVTARSFAARSGEHIDPNRELVGFGAANVAAGLFQGFVVTGADSRTAVGLVAGGSSPLVSISAAAALAVVVGLLSGPLYWLPQAFCRPSCCWRRPACSTGTPSCGWPAFPASSWRSACWPPWAWWASACCRAWPCRWAPRCCTPCMCRATRAMRCWAASPASRCWASCT